MNLIKIFQHNWLATLYINFKMLPFRQAVKLPIDVYHKIRVEKLSGTIRIDSKNIRRGMIKINARGSEMFSGGTFILSIVGEVVFHGSADLGYGCLLHVSPNATIEFGNAVGIGPMTKIFCNKKITFGNNIRVSWESQIFDTNFHYVQDVNTGEISERDGDIHIGDFNWFGNRCSIMKGTITPNRAIVASNSMTNKDYTQYGEYAMFAGMPAKYIKSGVQRMFEGVDI